MAIKKKKGGGGGANWMDTYGDMVTLLLCFFVLLYSMSTISEEKFRAIAQSFNPLAIPDITDPKGMGGPYSDPEIGDQNPGMEDPSTEQKAIDEIMNNLMASLAQMIDDKGMQNTIQVSMQGGKVYVQFSDTVFFVADRAEILPGGQEVLAQVCAILEDASRAIDTIQVQGHTAQARANQANEPRGDYRLAANRAMEVSLFIQDHTSIHPARISQESFGQWRPISSNQTAESRAHNRRVELVISGRNLDAEALNDVMGGFINRSEDGLATAGTQDQ